MLNVANNTLILNVVTLSVVMLNVIMLSVVAPSKVAIILDTESACFFFAHNDCKVIKIIFISVVEKINKHNLWPVL
jgi:hypothetical protein